MTEDELASIEMGFRWASPEHSVHRVIAALREARAEVLELENHCSDLEMDLDRANGFLGAARAEIACLRRDLKAAVDAWEARS